MLPKLEFIWLHLSDFPMKMQFVTSIGIQMISEVRDCFHNWWICIIQRNFLKLFLSFNTFVNEDVGQKKSRLHLIFSPDVATFWLEIRGKKLECRLHISFIFSFFFFFLIPRSKRPVPVSTTAPRIDSPRAVIPHQKVSDTFLLSQGESHFCLLR